MRFEALRNKQEGMGPEEISLAVHLPASPRCQADLERKKASLSEEALQNLGTPGWVQSEYAYLLKTSYDS